MRLVSAFCAGHVVQVRSAYDYLHVLLGTLPSMSASPVSVFESTCVRFWRKPQGCGSRQWPKQAVSSPSSLCAPLPKSNLRVLRSIVQSWRGQMSELFVLLY